MYPGIVRSFGSRLIAASIAPAAICFKGEYL